MVRFKALIIKYITLKKGSPIYKSTVGICLYTNKTKEESPILPLSVVAKAWPSVKQQPLYSYMTRFVRFLNWAFFDYESKISSISEITSDTVLAYLVELASKSGRSYVELAEYNITTALYYLYKNGIATGFTKDDFYVSNSAHSRKVFIDNVHNNYTLPRVIRTERIHDLDISLVFRMFDLAIRYTPRIALGLYLQVFGGLRCAEVVSLERSDLHLNPYNSSDALFVDLKDTDFRPDLRRGFLSQVKKPRKQKVIFLPGLFYTLFNLNSNNITDCNALFINARGTPMTEASYYQYFVKLKNKLIESLKNDDSLDLKLYASTLSSAQWATHIGRGIFSNLIAEKADTTAQIARARGDSCMDSSLPYLCDSQKIEEQIVETLEELYNNRTT